MAGLKSFKFSLESVLSYRRQMLDAATEEFAQAYELALRQEEALRRAEERYDAHCQDLRERQEAGMTAAEALMARNALTVLEREIQAITVKLEELRAQAEEKRLIMVEAKKDSMSLEKMREKRFDSYNREIQKKEEQTIDELVSTARVIAASES